MHFVFNSLRGLPSFKFINVKKEKLYIIIIRIEPMFIPVLLSTVYYRVQTSKVLKRNLYPSFHH